MRTDFLPRCRTILLDFDGPVCSVFHGYAAKDIAHELIETARTGGLHVSPALSQVDDPHEVLRQVNTRSPEMAREIELALQASEIRAVASAKPTPGAELVLQACAATGRQAAIVSNNTASAITAYLDQHGLSPLISGVFGRDPDDVSLMKPDTHLLELALRRLRAERSTTAFVGDTVTDMQAGQAALVWTVGFANKPGKWAALARAGADSLTTDMAELAQAL